MQIPQISIKNTANIVDSNCYELMMCPTTSYDTTGALIFFNQWWHISVPGLMLIWGQFMLIWGQFMLIRGQFRPFSWDLRPISAILRPISAVFFECEANFGRSAFNLTFKLCFPWFLKPESRDQPVTLQVSTVSDNIVVLSKIYKCNKMGKTNNRSSQVS